MAVKLITGLKTTADIESQDDGARIYGTISKGDRVLNVGNKWAYQTISNNCIRIKDGEALMQGRHVRQAPNTYTDVTINNGESGKKRYDIIVLRYSKTVGTGIENVQLAVVEGTPATSSPTIPSLTTGDIFTGCTTHEMGLYRVYINGLNISSVTKLFTTMGALDDILNLVYPVGAIYMSVSSTNPSTLFGGTWVSWGSGRVPVGVDTSDTDFSTVGKTGGEKMHTLTVAEMPSHYHRTDGNGGHYAWGGNSGGWPWGSTSGFASDLGNVNTGNSGGGNSHNNLQPYITCYMWKRTA